MVAEAKGLEIDVRGATCADDTWNVIQKIAAAWPDGSIRATAGTLSIPLCELAALPEADDMTISRSGDRADGDDAGSRIRIIVEPLNLVFRVDAWESVAGLLVRQVLGMTAVVG